MTQATNFVDSFFSKLKEQSFTILLLVGVMYYQNSLFTSQMEEYKRVVHEKDEAIFKLIDEERTRLLQRESYLMNQRDEFVKDLRDKTK